LGSTAAAVGEFLGLTWLMVLTGYLWIVASIAAWYSASGLMLNEAFGREVWGLGRRRISAPSVSIGVGEPGVIKGQA
jgi:hypothetical protein